MYAYIGRESSCPINLPNKFNVCDCTKLTFLPYTTATDKIFRPMMPKFRFSCHVIATDIDSPKVAFFLPCYCYGDRLTADPVDVAARALQVQWSATVAEEQSVAEGADKVKMS